VKHSTDETVKQNLLNLHWKIIIYCSWCKSWTF